MKQVKFMTAFNLTDLEKKVNVFLKNLHQETLDTAGNSAKVEISYHEDNSSCSAMIVYSN